MLANVPRVMTRSLPRRAAVAVEVRRLRRRAPIRYLPAGLSLRDRAGRRDVVGGDRVAQDGQHASAADRLDRPDVGGQVDEERRLLDVGALRVPLVQIAVADRRSRSTSALDVHHVAAYRSLNISGSTHGCRSPARLSSGVGQMSWRKTGLAVLVLCRAVRVVRSMSIVPARA